MAFTIQVTTDPTEEPITLAEAKKHSSIVRTDQDTFIESLITAARQYCEAETHRAFITQTVTLTLDEFASSAGIIHIPKPRLLTVDSFSYIDSDGATQTLTEDTDFKKDILSEPGRLVPVYNETWPTTRNEIAAVTIVYTAGYGAAAAVPKAIKQAMLLIFGHWYEHREEIVVGTITSKVPVAANTLLMQYKIEAVEDASG